MFVKVILIVKMAYTIAPGYLYKPFIISDYRFNYNNFAKKFMAGALQNLLSIRYFSPLLTCYIGLK